MRRPMLAFLLGIVPRQPKMLDVAPQAFGGLAFPELARGHFGFLAADVLQKIADVDAHDPIVNARETGRRWLMGRRVEDGVANIHGVSSPRDSHHVPTCRGQTDGRIQPVTDEESRSAAALMPGRRDTAAFRDGIAFNGEVWVIG